MMMTEGIAGGAVSGSELVRELGELIDVYEAWIAEEPGAVVSAATMLSTVRTVRSALTVTRPEWGEVNVAELLRDVSMLQAEAARHRVAMNDASSSMLSLTAATKALRGDVDDLRIARASALLEKVRAEGERDRARAVAVRLEQELAEVSRG